MPGPIADSTPLCTTCGMCCDGTIFQDAPLAEGEHAWAEKHRLTVIHAKDEDRFSLPCRCLAGTACGVYPDRAKICGDYSCKLLDRYRGGDVGLEQAKAIVETTRKLSRESKVGSEVERLLARGGFLLALEREFLYWRMGSSKER